MIHEIELSGGVKITLETFGEVNAPHWRPTKVVAPIHNVTVSAREGGRGTAPKAMALLNNPSEDKAKKKQAQDDNEGIPRPEDTDNSHLVGLSIGGPDVSGNVVPMYAYLNQGQWMQYEREIGQQKKDWKGKGELYVHVSVKYNGAGDYGNYIPNEISIKACGADGTQVGQERRLTNTKPEPEHIDPTNLFNARLRKLIKERWKAFDEDEFKIEDQQGFNKIKVPAKDVERPYAFLDKMYKDGELDQVFARFSNNRDNSKTLKFQNGAGFNQAQRWLIIRTNRLLSRGYLVSDAHNTQADERHSRLLEVPGDRGAQVDHIVPKGQSGSNSFSNAQVVSRQYNEYMKDRKDKDDKDRESRSEINAANIIAPSASASSAAALAGQGGRVLRSRVEKKEEPKSDRERDYKRPSRG